MSLFQPESADNRRRCVQLPADPQARCLRLRYRGTVPLEAAVHGRTAALRDLEDVDTVRAADDWTTLEVKLPRADRDVTALIPLPEPFMKQIGEAGGTLVLTSDRKDSRIRKAELLKTTADWKHLRLK